MSHPLSPGLAGALCDPGGFGGAKRPSLNWILLFPRQATLVLVSGPLEERGHRVPGKAVATAGAHSSWGRRHTLLPLLPAPTCSLLGADPQSCPVPQAHGDPGSSPTDCGLGSLLYGSAIFTLFSKVALAISVDQMVEGERTGSIPLARIPLVRIPSLSPTRLERRLGNVV